MDRKNLKQAGKNLFKKNYWHGVLIAFLMLLGQGGGFSFSSSSSDSSSLEGFDFSVAEEFIFSAPVITALSTGAIILTILSILIFSSLRCGGIRYFLKSRKNQPVDLGEVVQNFKDKTFLNVAKVTFFKNLFITLWTLLFIVPGIIKSFEYWAIDFILAVRPDIDRKEAHRLSKILMDGNKWDCFVLGLSFLGWHLLTIFTFGLLNIFYVNPYMQATYVEFFSDLRLQALAKGAITPADIPDYEAYNPYYQSTYDTPQNQPFTPPTYQQTWDNPYAPQQNSAENNFYTPQEPIEHPVEEPVEPVVDKPASEAVEPVIEASESEESNLE